MDVRPFISRHRRKFIIGSIVAVVILVPLYLLLKPKAPQYVTALAEKGDLQQTVEAVGTVTSEHDLELKFPGSGIVSAVPVQEGDHVVAGQMLAQLRAGSLAASVGIQAASLQSAQADLRKMEEGTRPEDIAIAEAQVANKQASLQVAQTTFENAKQAAAQAQDQLTTLQQEANTSLAGQVQTAQSTVLAQMVVAETGLASVEDIITKTIVADAISKLSSDEGNIVTTQRNDALSAIAAVRLEAGSMQSYKDALKVYQDAQNAATKASMTLDSCFTLLSDLPETSYFSSSARETYRQTISAQRSLVQGAGSTLSSAFAALQNASAGYDTRIATAQSSLVASTGAADRAQTDILTYQTALQAQQADLASKKAGTRQADLDSARARVHQAQASLAQASAMYNDTILRAPMDGVITHVNVKVGEAAPLTSAAVTLLGNTPFRIEMYISEVDVPRLALSQSGTIQLDAFPNVSYKIRVSEIDASPSLVDGVSKYRAKLDFLFPHDEFKLGMTGDVTVITGERKNVVSIPERAVITDGTRKYVRILNDDTVTQQDVTTGMEGQSGDVEILTGLQGGETIVVLQK